MVRKYQIQGKKQKKKDIYGTISTDNICVLRYIINAGDCAYSSKYFAIVHVQFFKNDIDEKDSMYE